MQKYIYKNEIVLVRSILLSGTVYRITLTVFYAEIKNPISQYFARIYAIIIIGSEANENDALVNITWMIYIYIALMKQNLLLIAIIDWDEEMHMYGTSLLQMAMAYHVQVQQLSQR